MKKLYRSHTNKMIAGIIGGVGEYLDMDATVLRLAYILIAVVTGVIPAVLAYLIAWAIVPEHSEVRHAHHTEK
jgi:phage shock protein C